MNNSFVYVCKRATEVRILPNCMHLFIRETQNEFVWLSILCFVVSKGQSAALGHFSVSIFLRYIDNKIEKQICYFFFFSKNSYV